MTSQKGVIAAVTKCETHSSAPSELSYELVELTVNGTTPHVRNRVDRSLYVVRTPLWLDRGRSHLSLAAISHRAIIRFYFALRIFAPTTSSDEDEV